MLITEIFTSVQGEGAAAGRPCTFVRLARCNLRCHWCDTKYSFTGGDERSLADVLADVAGRGVRLVCVTGGEPLLQPDVYPLMQRLLDAGKTVLIETGGHRSIEDVPAGVIRIVDVKCPGSGESAKNDWSNLDRLTAIDQVKFVVADRADYEFARDVVRRERLETRCAAVHFSPVHGELHPRVLSEWVLEDRLPVRVQLQVHKYIWGADVRGV